ncbi:MAG: hypothetical protein A3G43_03260 [Ignavibacteria bacterium RIFCSPLOWO2_12_FULL_56_21]|nr:MAG: hypothetical protein A3G43_03260 [Ignavibacteria bacterium RIFCSPLOWO2_12_FULL_56_21]
MPDLNLIDDEGGVEDDGGAVSAAPMRGGGGGGGGRIIIILFLVVLILAGAVYVLNSRGIIKLWGKKPTVMTVEEPLPENAYDEQMYAEQPMDSTMQGGEGQTGDVAMLETPPLDERAGAPAATKKIEKAGADGEMPGLASGDLAAMKGDYTIQVVAFREAEKAQDIKGNLEIAGYPAFVEKVPMKGGDWYTVRIGRYPSRDDAKEAVKTFAEQIRSNYVIDKIRTR